MIAQNSNVPKASRDKAHILVVDDNASMRQLLKGVLQDEGLSVELASSVTEARALLTQNGDRFDLVVSDINMPLETGFDLLRWIKSETSGVSQLPVLLTTAELPEPEHRLRGLMLGAVDYVVRPVDLREFAVRVLHAIENHQRIRSLERALEDSQCLAMVGRLLAASNHEIKNLAAVVAVTADQVVRLMGTRLPQLSAQDMALIRALQDSSGLLVDVARHINDLLDPSPPDQRQSLDLLALVQQVVTMMQPRVKPILLDVDQKAAPTVVQGLGHALRVKQVLVNVILNATDAIHELSPAPGGVITLQVGCDDGTAFIDVTDNGIGLPQAGVKSEFTAFSTTKKLRGGQGLGLWLCARLMHNVGGRLTLSSDGIGKGATARISLEKAPVMAIGHSAIDLERYFLPADEL